MERGVIITDENQSITVDALFPHSPQMAESIGLASDGRLVKSTPTPGQNWIDTIIDSGIALDSVEDALIHAAMERSQQNVSEAARLLGMTRPALAYRLKKSPADMPSSKG
ncbi:Bacterial regulatory protein, Fis family [compost metagenome]